MKHLDSRGPVGGHPRVRLGGAAGDAHSGAAPRAFPPKILLTSSAPYLIALKLLSGRSFFAYTRPLPMTFSCSWALHMSMK
jgi:hypothetical protein